MWPHYLLFTRYFRTQKLKIAIFAHCIMIVDPLAEDHPALSVMVVQLYIAEKYIQWATILSRLPSFV